MLGNSELDFSCHLERLAAIGVAVGSLSEEFSMILTPYKNVACILCAI